MNHWSKTMLGPLPVTGLCIVMCDTLLASEVKLMLGGFRKGLLVLKREIQEVISSIGRYWNCTECLQLLQPSQALGVHLIPGFFHTPRPMCLQIPLVLLVKYIQHLTLFYHLHPVQTTILCHLDYCNIFLIFLFPLDFCIIHRAG